MSEELSLLENIRIERVEATRLGIPCNHTAGLIYADYLTDRDDPRGDFLRNACELDTIYFSREPKDLHRKADLQKNLEKNRFKAQQIWRVAIRDNCPAIEQHDRFAPSLNTRTDIGIPKVTISSGDFNDTLPFAAVNLRMSREGYENLCDSTALSRINKLFLLGDTTNYGSIDSFLNSRHLHIEEFGYAARNPHTLTTIIRAIISPQNGNIKRIDLRPKEELVRGINEEIHTGILRQMIEDLTSPNHFPNLESVDLSGWGYRLSDDALRWLAAAPGLKKLRELDLGLNNLSGENIVRDIASSGGNLPALQILKLRNCMINDRNAQEFLDRRRALPKQLTELDLGENWINQDTRDRLQAELKGTVLKFSFDEVRLPQIGINPDGV